MTTHFKIFTPQEGLPEKDTATLIYVEGDSRHTKTGWAVGSYNGNRWVYDVPKNVFDHIAEYTGCSIPEGEDVVELGYAAHVTHWIPLPTDTLGLIRLSDVETVPTPTVRYNHETETLEIFGEPSPYSEDHPYYVEREDLDTPLKALEKMAHIAAKTWARGEKFLHNLAKAIADCIGNQSSIVN